MTCCYSVKEKNDASAVESVESYLLPWSFIYLLVDSNNKHLSLVCLGGRGGEKSFSVILLDGNQSETCLV